jgi:outer membrane protein TolC
MLTVAALYYNPAVQVGKAQLQGAEGARKTAAQRPNPTVTATPGYDATPSPLSPWLPMLSFDVPFETMGKRKLRKQQAQHHAESLRLSLASLAWQIRGEVRSNLVDYVAASQRERLVADQVEVFSRILEMQQQQRQAGAISGAETLPFRLSAQRAQLDMTDSRRQMVEARIRLAQSLGITSKAFDHIRIEMTIDQSAPGGIATSDSELRNEALHRRADVLASLAEYAATESALRLEIAKQYPDVRLQPGYQYDQGDSKWTLGIMVDLPIFNQNQGLIAEARAKREEAAARFLALQSGIIGELDRARQVFEVNAQMKMAMTKLRETSEQRIHSVEEQVKAGTIEKAELLNAQLERSIAALAELDGQARYQQSVGALEFAVQKPFSFEVPINASSNVAR